MVGYEHERLADALRGVGAQAPAPADTLVQKFGLPINAETRSEMTDCNRSVLVQAAGAAAEHRRCHKSGESAERVGNVNGSPRKRDGLGTLPEKRGGLFQRSRSRQCRRIFAAANQPAVANGGNAGRDRGFAPGNGARGDARRRAPAGASRCQVRDVFCPIEAAARIGRVGHHPNPAAAHVSVERLLPYAERRQRRLAIHPLSHVDSMYQD